VRTTGAPCWLEGAVNRLRQVRWVPSTRDQGTDEERASRGSVAVRAAAAPAPQAAKKRGRPRSCVERRPPHGFKGALRSGMLQCNGVGRDTPADVRPSQFQDRPRLPRRAKSRGWSAMGPVGRSARRCMAPIRRLSPTGPLPINLPTAVEPVRLSESHSATSCVALVSPLTIAPASRPGGYRCVTSVAVGRRVRDVGPAARQLRSAAGYDHLVPLVVNVV
jgi:hypothetical protein